MKEGNTMEKSHWNVIARRKIDAIRYTNPYEALKLYENYLKRYPDDYETKLLYASTLVTIKEFDLAHELLEEVKFEYKSNRKITENSETRKILDKCALYTEIRYLTYTEQYKKLYELLKKVPYEVREEFDIPCFYADLKMGKISQDNISNLRSYVKKQIYSYSEEDFRKCLNKHLYEHNLDKDEQCDKIFDKDFPVEEVLEAVKDNLNYDNAICSGGYSDVYIFKFDQCGKDNGALQG